MVEIVHETIGAKSRRIEITREIEKRRRRDIWRRYVVLPWNGIGLDQALAWFVLATIAASVFLFVTVTITRLALR